MNPNVKGSPQRVLITGAAGGIGAAAAAELRKRGARVVGLDLRATSDDVIACDVTDQESVDGAVAAAAERLGGLDCLINCAGISRVQSAGEAPGRDAEKVLAINLVGPWRVTSAALGHLRESRGRVVNVASGLALLTMPFAPAYCMSKRGLVAYSDALRAEHGDAITVTTVYPGYIRTPIHAATHEHGISLEGIVPAEGLDEAARTLARAAIGRPARDLATSRGGAVAHAVLRLTPRATVDRLLRRRLRHVARRGAFDDSRLAAAWRDRLLGVDASRFRAPAKLE